MPLYQKVPKQKAVYNGRSLVLREIETHRGIIKSHLPTTAPLDPMKERPAPQKGSGSSISYNIEKSEMDKKQLKQKLMQEIYKRL